MTVAALPAVAEYVEDGVSTSFPVPYRFKAPTDLIVERVALGDVEPLTFGVDYSVTGGATDAGGTVTRSAATWGATLRIRRRTARAQEMRYPTGGRFPAESHEDALDRQMLIAQEQDDTQADLDARALMVPTGEAAVALPNAAVRAGAALVFDAFGQPVAMPVGSFPAGPTGPANSTYATRTLLKAAPTTNGSAILLEIGYQGTFSWTPGNFTGAADEYYIFASTVASLTSGAWVRQDASGYINARNYNAIGNGQADDTAALKAATTAANALGLPLYVPTGRYVLNDTIQPKAGIFGDGRPLTKFIVTNRAAFADGRPVIRIGWTLAEDNAQCADVPCRGFWVQGAGIRTAERSGDYTTMMFAGQGVLLDEQCFNVDADVRITGCYKGLTFKGLYGHVSATDVNISSCWYNVFVERNGYDYKLYNPTITGALFSSIGATGVVDPGKPQLVGGIGGLTIFGGHGGFSPYVYFLEGGAGTLGFFALTAIDFRHEYVGNRVMSVPDDTHQCFGLRFINPGHSWTSAANPDYAVYTILNDPGHPVQDVALNLGNITGGAFPSYREGEQWQVGTTGKHTRINNLGTLWQDDVGLGGYRIDGDGRERLIYSGQPGGYTSFVPVPAMTLTATGNSRHVLATFAVPLPYDGSLYGEIDISGSYYSSTDPIDMQVRVKAGDANEQTLGIVRLGLSGNLNGRFRFLLGRRTSGGHPVQVILQSTSTSTITINSGGVNGTARMAVSNTSSDL